ncbi:MAG TPA: GDP-L-fucose synthase [Casimicrobiaceae bacterium]|jgi:GDP-L-fucose synthase
MDKSTPIYVAGHRGLAGSALCRELARQGFDRLIVRTHRELDLAEFEPTRALLMRERPQVMFVAASKVGGIAANSAMPVDFLMGNLALQVNLFRAAHEAGVERVLFLGSSCIYPRDAPQPLAESALLSGPLESTNRPYAVAKIAGVEMCWAYNRQYGHRWLSAMPTNLYGTGDNYDLATSHVLPALLRKAHEAHARGGRRLDVWGTGHARREFLHADDLARALVMLATLPDALYAPLVAPDTCPLINIGSGHELTIRDLAALLARVVGFIGDIAFDASKPDGSPRKIVDSTRVRALGWRPAIDLATGIASTYADFKARFAAGTASHPSITGRAVERR